MNVGLRKHPRGLYIKKLECGSKVKLGVYHRRRADLEGPYRHMELSQCPTVIRSQFVF